MLEVQRLKNLIDSTNAGTWEANVQTGITLFNERWAEIIGYTLEGLQPTDNNTWLRLCHPEDLHRAEKVIKSPFEHKTEFYEMELRAKHKNGNWIWVHDKGKVVEWDSDGQPLLLAPVGHVPIHNYISIPVFVHDRIAAVLSAVNKPSDYTEEDALNLNLLASTVWTAIHRIEAEALLRAEKELFSTTLLSIGEGVLVTDASGRIKLMNPPGEQLVGCPQEEALGKTYHEICHVINLQTREALPDPVQYVLETGKSVQTPSDAGLVRKDGSEIYFLATVAPIFSSEGPITGTVMTARDITDRKKSRKRWYSLVSMTS